MAFCAAAALESSVLRASPVPFASTGASSSGARPCSAAFAQPPVPAPCCSLGRSSRRSRRQIAHLLATQGRAAHRRMAVAAGAVAALDSGLKTYDYDQLSPAEIKALLQRPRIDFTSILSTVRGVATSPHARERQRVCCTAARQG